MATCYALTITVGMVLAGLVAGCHFQKMEDARNISPVILGFTVNNERVTETTIREGDQTAIGVVLYDPNVSPEGVGPTIIRRAYPPVVALAYDSDG